MLWGMVQGWRLWEGGKGDVALPQSRLVSRARSSPYLTLCVVIFVLMAWQELQGGKGDGPSHREAREDGWGWIPGAMLAWATQPLEPSTIHPDSSFVEDEGSGSQVSFRSQLGHYLEAKIPCVL